MPRGTVVAAGVAALAAWLPGLAAAHPEGSSGVKLSYADTHVVADLEIPLEEMGYAVQRSLSLESALAARAELEQYIRERISVLPASARWTTEVGRARVGRPGDVPSLLVRVTLRPPDGVVRAFRLRYRVVVDALETHEVYVTVAREGAKPRTLDILSINNSEVQVPGPGVAPDRSHAFGAMVRQGAHHIADGTDHVLFLVTLLLPAPLLARRRRWTPAPSPWRAGRRIVHVVTAFAIGHSLTLAAAASGILDVPTRPVEIVIALSIAVAAAHAIRPLVAGGEAPIAFGFGLVHGLGFAEVLRELGLSGSELVVGLLGFNLGIELAQLVVVGLLMPSLWLLSRTRVYAPMREFLAAFAFVASLLWMSNRADLTDANPVEPVLDALVSNPLVVAAGLAVVALGTHGVERRRRDAAAG